MWLSNQFKLWLIRFDNLFMEPYKLAFLNLDRISLIHHQLAHIMK